MGIEIAVRSGLGEREVLARDAEQSPIPYCPTLPWENSKFRHDRFARSASKRVRGPGARDVLGDRAPGEGEVLRISGRAAGDGGGGGARPERAAAPGGGSRDGRGKIARLPGALDPVGAR